tara:strand:+ start:1732 stop:2406 length:675 start_codon:yes stop_codon:yes gene_type:complete
MSFTTITGWQAKYIEDGRFEVIDDARLSLVKTGDSYFKVRDGVYVHLPTFYEEAFDEKNGDTMVSQILRPAPKRKPRQTCKPRMKPKPDPKPPVFKQVKLEPAAIREQVKEYIKNNPNKTMDDLLKYLRNYYNRDLTKYMDIIRACSDRSVQFLTWIEELDSEYGGNFRMAFKTPSGLRYVKGDYAAGILQLEDMSNIPCVYHDRIKSLVGEKISEHMTEYTSD